MKARCVTYVAAGALLLGSICASEPVFAADGGAPGSAGKPEQIPHVTSGHAVPIPEYWQPDGPWARPPAPIKAVSAPRVDDEFCMGGTPGAVPVCLELKQLLRLLQFGA